MATSGKQRRGGFWARLRYQFDGLLAARPLVLIGWLVVILLILIAMAGALLVLLDITPEGGTPLAYGEAMWAALLHVLGGGTIGGGWAFRALMLVLALAGIAGFAALIALLSVALSGRRDQWRKGRSDVFERDHIVILNWSAAIFDVISELVIANNGRKRLRIVVMAAKDMVEMKDEITARVPNLGKTLIICRTGNPADRSDLTITSPQTSRAIIVLSPGARNADSHMIKTVLALAGDSAPRASKYRIAAEIRDSRNVELARTAGGKAVQLVPADELIARIMVHSSRQPGLSDVYSELLNFGGGQLHTVAQKPIEGSSFGDALMAYDTATLIGLCDAAGRVYLNPPMETLIRPDLKAVLIAESEAAIKVTASTLNVDHTAITLYRRLEKKPERTLLLGWNRRGPAIAFELSRCAAPGSLLTIAADTPELQSEIGNLLISGGNLQVEYGIVDIASRSALEGLNIPSYDHVLVLGYADHFTAEATDTGTLITLLQLRKIAEAAGNPINVVSEMIDSGNRALAAITGTDDFVVSNQLESLLLVQATENGSLSAILADLLDEQGSEFHLRPAELYVEFNHEMSFYTVTEACRQRGEVAIGYVRKRAPEQGRDGGVVINPTKSETLSFQAGDRLIVLARQ